RLPRRRAAPPRTRGTAPPRSTDAPAGGGAPPRRGTGAAALRGAAPPRGRTGPPGTAARRTRVRPPRPPPLPGRRPAEPVELRETAPAADHPDHPDPAGLARRDRLGLARHHRVLHGRPLVLPGTADPGRALPGALPLLLPAHPRRCVRARGRPPAH